MIYPSAFIEALDSYCISTIAALVKQRLTLFNIINDDDNHSH